jgi:excisionase family DNA binding protein
VQHYLNNILRDSSNKTFHLIKKCLGVLFDHCQLKQKIDFIKDEPHFAKFNLDVTNTYQVIYTVIKTNYGDIMNLITITEAASRMKISRQMVWFYVRTKELTARRIGKLWIIDEADLLSFMESRGKC